MIRRNLNLKGIFKSQWILVASAFLLTFVSCKEQSQISVETSAKSIAQSVKLIKVRIQEKGIVTTEEALGLNLLNRMMTGEGVDHDLVKEVHSYMDASDPSRLSKELINIFDLVQTQGNIADVDEAALKELVALTSLDGGGK